MTQNTLFDISIDNIIRLIAPVDDAIDEWNHMRSLLLLQLDVLRDVSLLPSTVEANKGDKLREEFTILHKVISHMPILFKEEEYE